MNKDIPLVLSEEAYEMVLRWVDRDGYDPLLTLWRDAGDGWLVADILSWDDSKTGGYVRVQETAGVISYRCYDADHVCCGWHLNKRVLTVAELNAALPMLTLVVSV